MTSQKIDLYSENRGNYHEFSTHILFDKLLFYGEVCIFLPPTLPPYLTPLTSKTPSLPLLTSFSTQLNAAFLFPLAFSHKSGQVPWWSLEIHSAVKTRHRLSRIYLSTKSQEDFIKYKQVRAKARALIRLAKAWSCSPYVAGINTPQSPFTMLKDIK